MNAHGIVHKYGDHVDTDVIIPARYLNTQSHKELASHCMEDIDKDFIHRVKDGDIMVAGVNFGCGSSREHAPVAITYQAEPFPPFIKDMIARGGLMASLKAKEAAK